MITIRHLQLIVRQQINCYLTTNRRLNILEAGRYTYNNYGCSIDLCGLYDIVDELNVKMNKQDFKNRIAYILGRKDSQIDCY